VCRGFWDRLLDIEAKTIEFKSIEQTPDLHPDV